MWRNEDKWNQIFVFLVEQKSVLSGEEQERKITTYEDAMNKIKDTTGVSDIKEVVQRFLSQGETQKHLEQLKTNNEKMLVRLKEDKVQNYCPFFLLLFPKLMNLVYKLKTFKWEVRIFVTNFLVLVQCTYNVAIGIL